MSDDTEADEFDRAFIEAGEMEMPPRNDCERAYADLMASSDLRGAPQGSPGDLSDASRAASEARDVRKWAETLHQYATHFEMRDWAYTRDTGIYRILHKNGWRTRRSGGRFYFDPSRLPFRLKAAAVGVWDDMTKPAIMPEWRVGYWAMFKARLRSNNGPDGILDNGNVIVHWEETGEYIQLVQPSIGEMFANWMNAEPENEHARRIAAEMQRISDGYRDRIAAAKEAA